MGFIALAAVDFRAMRALFNHEIRTTISCLGAIPMVNVLVVGLLIRRRCRRSRRFLSGLVLWGAMAVAVYVLVASLFAEQLVTGGVLG
jgi:hypothetical protein